MKHIQIGNDFRVSWTLTQLGEAFSLVGKTYDIEVSNPYGAILVSDVVAEDNVLSFNIPAAQQVYLGNYDITLKITNEDGQTWQLRQCDAFTLVPCDCGEIVNIVQLESGIVFPSHGLSAYELAVLNGEYQGDYEGYQAWLAQYANNVADQAKGIADGANATANEAKVIAEQAAELSIASATSAADGASSANASAESAANSEKAAKELATELREETNNLTAKTLNLTVKDNGNIVLANAEGVSQEFMPATPSGDPMHYIYEKCGGVWNGDTGYWELNGLTDMTNEDMRDSYVLCNMAMDNTITVYKYGRRLFRTNFYKNVGDIALNMIGQVLTNSFIHCEKTEVINLGDSYLASSGCVNAFSKCTSLREIQGILRVNSSTDLSNMFNVCKNLEDVKIARIGRDISFNSSPKLTKASLLFMIENANTTTFTITLHADVYAWASTDEDVQTALSTKTNITLASA